MFVAPAVADGDASDQRRGGIAQRDGADDDGTYGPFFEDEAPSETSWATASRKKKTPVLSVGGGALCFVEGSHCRVSLLVTGEVAAGMRLPSSDKGPDLPHSHFGFRGGVAIRPLMFSRHAWHPWGVGFIGSWTRGTGAATVEGDSENQTVEQSERTDSWRLAMVNQLWLGQRPYAMHIDFTIGAARSPVLTSGVALWGTHAEVAFGWGGWAALFAGGDFLDRDARVLFGVRAHGIAAAPAIALAVLGLALGGAL